MELVAPARAVGAYLRLVTLLKYPVDLTSAEPLCGNSHFVLIDYVWMIFSTRTVLKESKRHGQVATQGFIRLKSFPHAANF